jgi:hypothetical protein
MSVVQAEAHGVQLPEFFTAFQLQHLKISYSSLGCMGGLRAVFMLAAEPACVWQVPGVHAVTYPCCVQLLLLSHSVTR